MNLLLRHPISNGLVSVPVPTNKVLDLDASNSASYSGTGATWKNLYGGHIGYINGATWNSKGYFHFSNENNYVRIPAYNVSEPLSWTVGLWFRSTTVPILPIYTRNLFSLGVLKALNKVYIGQDSHYLSYEYINNSGTKVVSHTSSVNIDDGKWHHFIWSFNGVSGSNINVSIDGVITSHIASTSSTQLYGHELFINALDDTVLYKPEVRGFIGDVSKVEIYNSALSSAQLSAVYNFQKPTFGIK